MLVITKKIDEILYVKNLSRYKLSKLTGYDESYLNHVMRGDRPFSDNVKEKILPVLEVNREEFEGWILADKYSKKVLGQAIQVKKEAKFTENDKLILTTKLDEILHKKGLSRTKLSKIIGYSQGRLNEIITGKKPVSKKVMKGISAFLDISENEIKSWIIADKYSLKTLMTAVNT